MHERGVLLRGEADYQLHWIYLWYENQPKRAPRAARTACATRYPGNPHFVAAHRRGRGSATSTTPAPASAAWQALVDARRAKRRPACWRKRAGRLGAAAQLDALDGDRSRASPSCDQRRRDGAGAAVRRPRARADGCAGTLLDRLGQRDRRVAAYKAALADVPVRRSRRHRRDRARDRPVAPCPTPAAAEAYRLSLVGLARLRARRAGRRRTPRWAQAARAGARPTR